MQVLSARRLVGLTATLAGLNLSLFGYAHAQAIQISPVSIELSPGQMATTLMITNKGSDPSTLQIRPFRWSQPGGVDQLTATGDLMVSPPITNIEAGSTQTFRLVLRVPAEHDEAGYRLLLDQLPPPAMAGEIRIALRFSIPVFAEPDNIVGAHVTWRVNTGPNGAILVGANQGSRHIRVLNPVLISASGQRISVKPGQMPYILPGAQHDWPLATGVNLIPGSTLHLVATSDAGPVDATVHVFGP